MEILSFRNKTSVLETTIFARMMTAASITSYARDNRVPLEHVEDFAALRARGTAIEKIGEEKTRTPAGINSRISPERR